MVQAVAGKTMSLNFFFYNINQLVAKFGWMFLWIMATAATTQIWQNTENTGPPIYAHIIYLHTPHCTGHNSYKKWTNRSREYNSWRWLWFIDFPYTRTIYLSFWCYIIPPHKKHYRKADCRDFIRLKTEATTHELHKPRFSDSVILTIFSGSASSS
jgi:hypothetical protein